MKLKTFTIFIVLLLGGALGVSLGVLNLSPSPQPTPTIAPEPTAIHTSSPPPATPVVRDGGPNPPTTKPSLGGTPASTKSVYRFQQAYFGDLWAIPTEPVHPNTRGMFIRPNDAGGWNSTSSDSCWIALPVNSIAGRYWEYVDGHTGNHYRVDVNAVLNRAVGEGNMATQPVNVPLTEPLAPNDIKGGWDIELEESQKPTEEFNLGQRVADRIRGGSPVNGIHAHQLVDCQDGSGRNCYMQPPTPLSDSWDNDRDYCLSPPQE